MDQTNTVPAVAAEPSREQIRALLDKLNVVPDCNLIGLLQDVQDEFGYLPGPALVQISRRTRIPLSRIHGVVSFYAQFYSAPRGRHTIRCCRGTACHVRGAGQILDSIKRTLNIDEDQSTPDLKFYLETVACLGTCFLAPVIMIDEEYFGKLTPQRVQTIIQNFPD